MDSLQNLVDAIVTAEAKDKGISTLGELRAVLKILPPETPVRIDRPDGTAYGAPSTLASYRGYYERLAIGVNCQRDDWETAIVKHACHPTYDPDPSVAHVTMKASTAGELLAALNLADGEGFGGYKGGTYTMDSGTFLHVAEYGDCGLMVVGLRIEDGAAVIETAEETW